MAKYRSRPGAEVDAFMLSVGPEGELPEGIRPSLKNRGNYEYRPDPEREHWSHVCEGDWIILEDGKYHTMSPRDFVFHFEAAGDTPPIEDGTVRLPGYSKPEPPKEAPLTKHDKALAKAAAKKKASKKKASKKTPSTPKPDSKEEN